MSAHAAKRSGADQVATDRNGSNSVIRSLAMSIRPSLSYYIHSRYLSLHALFLKGSLRCGLVSMREPERPQGTTAAPVMLNQILLSLHTVEHTQWVKGRGGSGVTRVWE